MRRFVEARLSSRPSIWIFLAVLALVTVIPAQAEPSAATNAFLASLAPSGSGCAAAALPATPDLPVFTPAPEPRRTGVCSPLCGIASCLGAAVGSPCTRPNFTQGICKGPVLGKKCIDGLPMCTC